MGQCDIRKLLIVGAMSVIRWVVRKGGSANRWLANLVARKPRMVAEAALAGFEGSDLATRYPAIAPSWRRAWTEVIPFLNFPPGVRRLIYTTNAIEALNSKIRRAVRTRGHFPGDEAAAKLIYLA